MSYGCQLSNSTYFTSSPWIWFGSVWFRFYKYPQQKLCILDSIAFSQTSTNNHPLPLWLWESRLALQMSLIENWNRQKRSFFRAKTKHKPIKRWKKALAWFFSKLSKMSAARQSKPHQFSQGILKNHSFLHCSYLCFCSEMYNSKHIFRPSSFFLFLSLSRHHFLFSSACVPFTFGRLLVSSSFGALFHFDGFFSLSNFATFSKQWHCVRDIAILRFGSTVFFCINFFTFVAAVNIIVMILFYLTLRCAIPLSIAMRTSMDSVLQQEGKKCAESCAMYWEREWTPTQTQRNLSAGTCFLFILIA